MPDPTHANEQNGSSFRLFLLGSAILAALPASALWRYRSSSPVVLHRYSVSYAAILAMHVAFMVACLALAGPLRGIAAGWFGAFSRGASRMLRSGWLLGASIAIVWIATFAFLIQVSNGGFARSRSIHLASFGFAIWASYWLAGAARPEMRDKVRAVAKLTVCFLLAGFGLVAAEYCLRANPGLLPGEVLCKLPEHGDSFFSFYEFDADTTVGYRYRPGVHFAQELRASAAANYPSLRGLVRPLAPEEDVVLTKASFTSDRLGYSNAEPILATYPIVVSGDSFTSYSVVPRPWPTILAEKTGKPVLNVGLQGYGPPNEVEAILRFGLSRKPETVILGYFEGNDIIDSQQYATRKASKLGWDEYIMATLPLLERQITYHLLKHFVETVFGPDKQPLDPKGDYAYPFTTELGGKPIGLGFAPSVIASLSLSKEKIAALKGFHSFEEYVVKLKKETDAAGAKILLVYFPTKEHIYCPLLPKDVLPRKLGGATVPLVSKDGELEAPRPGAPLVTADELLCNVDGQREAVRALLGKLDIEVLDLTPAFQAAAKSGTQLYWPTDNHWTPAGHELAAAEIAKRFGAAR